MGRPRYVYDLTNGRERALRCRVEQGKHGFVRRRVGWRYVVERAWSQIISSGMAREEHWKPHENGPWVETEEEALALASAYLDDIEKANDSKRYVE